ncbi:hypothetical protein VNO77_02689 [Canavalia gladiata]|uniref:Uncharacterized protein n=1 Tax=Canavalia gladiata TaxID=3824 RepID=A0AAN9R390_CANGL
MKLEFELASLHSDISLGCDFQSFKQKDNDVDSTGYKSEDFIVQEYETRVSTNIKRSPNSPINDPPEETNSFEDSTNLYMDRSVTECEAEVCPKDASYKIIKDICVDEEGPTKDSILFGRKVDENINNFFSSWSCENKQTMKDNIGTNVLNPPATEESHQVFSKHYQSKDLMQQEEATTQKFDDNIYKEVIVPGDKVLLPELPIENSRPSDTKGDEIEHNHVKVVSEPELNPQLEKPRNVIEDEVISSPVLELAVNELNNNINDSSGLRQENRDITNQFDHLALGTCGETQNEDVKSDSHDATNQVHNKLGPLPYSRSISLRSDSSTASARSFSFPTLQPEWNSSPVRMEKPDRSGCKVMNDTIDNTTNENWDSTNSSSNTTLSNVAIMGLETSNIVVSNPLCLPTNPPNAMVKNPIVIPSVVPNSMTT